MVVGPTARVNRCVTGRGCGGEGSEEGRATMRHPTIEEGVHMKLGVVFPQTEIGSDPAVVRDLP